jgi:hypothetical protein
MLDTTKIINPNGCGIGLTVSRKYIECLGGELTVESELDKGTTMTFILPIEKEEQLGKIEEKKEGSRCRSSTNLKFLISNSNKNMEVSDLSRFFIASLECPLDEERAKRILSFNVANATKKIFKE